jgi:hypothetical protein
MEGISCSINASVGREKEMEIIPGACKKQVMVIGGDWPVEAARSGLGHSVPSSMGERLRATVTAAAPRGDGGLVSYFERQFELLEERAPAARYADPWREKRYHHVATGERRQAISRR